MSYALPTSFSGSRVYTKSSSTYRSKTTTNGYEPGSSVYNTISAWIDDRSTTTHSYTRGEQTIYSQRTSWKLDAYHGIGTGSQIRYEWKQN